MNKYKFPDPRYFSRVKSALERGEFRIVAGRLACEMCGSNCGQCGDTDILGEFSRMSDAGKLDNLVKNLFKPRTPGPNFVERQRIKKWLTAYEVYCKENSSD